MTQVLGVSLSQGLQVTVSGLATGSLYALLLLGILLVYQVSKAVNFAHGQIGMVAAFGAYYLYERQDTQVWLALVCGFVAASALSAATYWIVLRRVREGRSYDLIATLGILLLLTGLGQNLFGGSSYEYLDILNSRQTTLADVFVNWNDLLVIGLTFVLFGVAYLVLALTPLGLTVRASASDPSIAQSVGIAVARTRLITWALAGVLAATAGVLLASRLAVDAFYITPFLINAFIAGILGGLDRFAAPLAIAIGLGVFEGWCVLLLGSTARIPALFVLIITVLLILPRRFLEDGDQSEARA